jgi:opacity protein-like surface antigen
VNSKFVIISAGLAFAPLVAAAQDQPSQKSGSVYSSYGASAFVRGGYAFSAHGGGASGSVDAITLAAGFAPIPKWRWGKSTLGFETEAVYYRDGEEIDLGALGVIDTTLWGLTGLLSLRYEYDMGAIRPFMSAGVGPAYWRASIDDGVTKVSDGDFKLGYSGRAGFEAVLSDRVSLEAAYRYLGATVDGTVGFHSAELGLNLGF